MKPAVRDRLDRTIEDIGPLPVLSGTVARVRGLSADPDATTPQLVAVIDDDEAFSANLLRYANSAAYARPLRARTIHQAVTMVGRDALARIAMESATYSLLEQMPGTGGRSRGAMHLHAVSVASCAVEIAQRTGASAEVVHLAGLLHDIGNVIPPRADAHPPPPHPPPLPPPPPCSSATSTASSRSTTRSATSPPTSC